MASSSRKETYDSNTPSSLSSRNGLYRRFPKGVNTIQSDRGSISNSSVHTTSPATTSEDLFDYTEINPAYLGGVPSVYDPKSFHSLEKQTLRFRNQSQSTIRIIRDAGSVSSSTATFSSARSSNMIAPSLEDEDGSPDDILLEDSAPALPDPDETRAREARVLESKVARVASSNYSVEEVFALQKEVDHRLSEATAADTSTELPLSSLLLKTILANHFASKAANDRESSLKFQIDRLERELHNLLSQKAYYNEKVQECRSLRIELSRFVTTPTTPFVSSTSQSSAFPPGSRVGSPTSFPPNIVIRPASVAHTPPTHSVATNTNRPEYAGPTTTSSVLPFNNSNVATAPSHSQKGPTSIGAPASPVPTQSAPGADTSPQGVNSLLMGALRNAGFGAGGGSPLPADSSVASDTAYPYRAKALYTYTASPYDPNEISFSKGEDLDIMHKYGRWWQARKGDGAVGIVSKDLLQII